MNLRTLYALMIFTIAFNSCHSQKTSLIGFNNCKPKISYEKKKNSEMINRGYSDNVNISFFQDFSDSVKISVNDTLIFNQYITHDSNLVSTTSTGVNFSYSYSDKKNDIKVFYVNQKKYLNFHLNKKYPLYSIHSYLNGPCWVSARKNAIIIK